MDVQTTNHFYVEGLCCLPTNFILFAIQVTMFPNTQYETLQKKINVLLNLKLVYVIQATFLLYICEQYKQHSLHVRTYNCVLHKIEVPFCPTYFVLTWGNDSIFNIPRITSFVGVKYNNT